MNHANVSPIIRDCISACTACHEVCVETVDHCLRKGGTHAEPHHIRLLLDCAEICQACANFMLRGSDLHTGVCAVCAEVCQRCAEDCGRMSDDEEMRSCAEKCRECAQSCMSMTR